MEWNLNSIKLEKMKCKLMKKYWNFDCEYNVEEKNP
jgi:hypothetical protein